MPARYFLATFATALLLGCGDGVSEPEPQRPREPVRIVIAEGDQQTAATAMPLAVNPTVMVTDISGSGVSGVAVRFTTQGGGWVTETDVITDAAGRASTTWYLGPRPGGDNFLFVSSPVGPIGFRAYSVPFTVGESYRGRTGLVEFTMGDIPLILTASHGGSQEPASLPVRTTGLLTRDAGTLELVQEMSARIRSHGSVPHMLVSHVHPARVDVDAAMAEGTGGVRAAEQVWREYHGFLVAARQYVQTQQEHGLLLDVHGHSASPRIELGYLLSAAELMQDDQVINQPSFVQRSSIRAIAEENQSTLSYIVRGGGSLGALLKERGYEATPSPIEPLPGAPYTAGGFTTTVHGSRDGSSNVSAIYMHVPAALRTTPERAAFGGAVVESLNSFFQAWYRGLSILPQ